VDELLIRQRLNRLVNEIADMRGFADTGEAILAK
jgi:hypothetical protein